MVTIINYETRQSNDGKEFFLLQLQGEVEAAISQTTGRPYLTARKTTISTTFNEITCKGLVGKQLPGSIAKVLVDDYKFIIPETKEVVVLDFTYMYTAEENQSMEAAVFEHPVLV